MRSRLTAAGAAIFFFISGSAALIYPTAWQRLFVIFAGGDIQAVTLIVTAFMLGLGGGYVIGGWLADQQKAAGNLLAFALVEAGIGIWGCCSEWLYHDMLCQQLAPLAGTRITGTVVVIMMLLPPTLLMGMSLPLLACALTRKVGEAAVNIGCLYGMNTLGAAAGAFLTTWYLLPQKGIAGSIDTAALMNFVCAVGILPFIPLALGEKPKTYMPAQPMGASAPTLPSTSTSTSTSTSMRMRGFLVLHAVTGFLALGLEIVWFRVLGVMLKFTAFTFGTLLGIYLAGLGAGALTGIWMTKHSKHPLRTFLWLQGSLAVYAGLSLMALLLTIHHAPWCAELLAYLGSYEPLDVNSSLQLLKHPQAIPPGLPNPALLPILHGLIPMLIIMPVTFLMGFSFPFLQKAVQTDLSHIGTRTGLLQAANIAGNVAGSLLVGTLFIPWLGSARTLEILVITGVALGLLALGGAPWFRLKAASWLALALVTLTAIPTADEFWALIHGSSPEKLVHVEDSTGVTALKKVTPTAAEPGHTQVYVNGAGQSWLPYGNIHSVLGALPALLHPHPQRIAIIGLGSGDTAYSAASRYQTEEVVCVEIIAGQIEALKKHHARHPSPSIQALLSEDRIRHVHGDGRHFLITTDERFDIIEADALRPNSAGSGILYSEEYFQLMLKRLKPGGYAVTWVPTSRVRNTFLRVFPHVLDLDHIIIGSPDPIDVTSHDLRRRLGHLEVREHFRHAEIPIHQLLIPYANANLRTHLVGPETDRSQFTDINTDLHPHDEFHLSWLWEPEPEVEAINAE
ncbi:MAG: spermidine synthase [Verrucomicrobiota bacterium]